MNGKPRPPATCHPDRPHIAKGLCRECYGEDYEEKNRAKRREQRKARNSRHPLRAYWRYRINSLRCSYGLEPSEIIARLAAQDGLCKICSTSPAIHLDHNHATGDPRSFLCPPCNQALGLFSEDPAVLRRAAEYVELWATPIGLPLERPIGRTPVMSDEALDRFIEILRGIHPALAERQTRGFTP